MQKEKERKEREREKEEKKRKEDGERKKTEKKCAYSSAQMNSIYFKRHNHRYS